ncbi:MAG: RluA family pseudouridine synthase, partial [Planctomycetes bacterium]|nr:RluA family pseudouridine synthase [Planctomycetota bacterium]
EPETGRHHQIRLHFSEIGHPLYGDRIYGDRLDPVHVHRQLLHASSVQFTHPDDGTPVRIESHLPLDMRQAMGRLKDL